MGAVLRLGPKHLQVNFGPLLASLASGPSHGASSDFVMQDRADQVELHIAKVLSGFLNTLVDSAASVSNPEGWAVLQQYSPWFFPLLDRLMADATYRRR